MSGKRIREDWDNEKGMVSWEAYYNVNVMIIMYVYSM